MAQKAKPVKKRRLKKPDWGVRLGVIRKSYGRRIAQMATSENGITALQRTYALKEGLICFFTSLYGCTHYRENTPFAAKREIASRLF